MEPYLNLIESDDVIGAEVYGVDLAQPLPPDVFATLEGCSTNAPCSACASSV